MALELPIRPPLDELDQGLIELLRHDGRASGRELGEALGASKATVAKRIRRLADDRVLRVVGVTDVETFGFQHQAFVKVRVADRSVDEIGAALADIPELLTVTRMFGEYDIVAVAVARDLAHLDAVVNVAVRNVYGVDLVHADLALKVYLFGTEWGILSGPTPPPIWAIGEAPVDASDLAIIERLQIDGRTSNKAIAEALGVSEGTVRARIKRLEQDGYIRIIAITDWSLLGSSAYAYVHVDVHGEQLHEVARTVVKLPGTSSQFVATILGEANLLIGAIAVDRPALAAFVDEVAGLPGVRRLQVTEGAGLYKHNYTWCRIVVP
jgi:Lrp/AsnC family transcriptional regulator for asnA, asnC and gidA